MSVEINGIIPPEEWRYLEGVLDQGLVFGIWPSPTQKGVFAHRIDLYNTSRDLVTLLQERFGGKIPDRFPQNRKVPARKIHYKWTVANAEEGLDCLNLIHDHLYSKADLAKRYSDFLEGLLDDSPDINELLDEFNNAKNSPVLEDIYLPSPRNLGGRLDANGFIGIQTRPNASLSRAYAQVYLGTKFPGLSLALKEKYGGSSTPRKESYLWTVNENEARNVLETVLPHLRNMRERALLVLDFEDVNKRLSTKGRGSKQRDLLFEALHPEAAFTDRAEMLRLGYITKSRELNDHPA